MAEGTWGLRRRWPRRPEVSDRDVDDRYRVGEFTLDVLARMLAHGDAAVALSTEAFALCAYGDHTLPLSHQNMNCVGDLPKVVVTVIALTRLH